MSDMVGQSSFNFWCWTQKCKFALISFMGFPAILSTLQPFQICIYNRKYSKLTFSNSSQLIWKRFMTNLHASLESTCKSRIFQDCHWCQKWGGSIIFHHVQVKSELKNFRQDPGLTEGGTCPQTHIHHSDFISHALLGCVWLKMHVLHGRKIGKSMNYVVAGHLTCPHPWKWPK